MRRICELGLIRAQAFSAQGRLREAGDIYSSLQRTLNEAGADMIVKYGVAYGRFLLAQGDYLTAVTVNRLCKVPASLTRTCLRYISCCQRHSP